MGRRKIEIARIQNERHRQVTFAKRKLGVMKKATELSILCDVNVAVIVFAANQKMSVYSSCPINTLVQRYLENRDTAEARAAAAPPGLPPPTARTPPSHMRVQIGDLGLLVVVVGLGEGGGLGCGAGPTDLPTPPLPTRFPARNRITSAFRPIERSSGWAAPRWGAQPLPEAARPRRAAARPH